MTDWWEDFFDADYIRLWEGTEEPDKTAREAKGLIAVLGLTPGSKVLDAPCGYGRIAHALAERGSHVLGLDLSTHVLAEAERRRGALPADRLRYRRHDLRKPIEESGFDAALNLFSSLGYGSEDDDLAILSNLGASVRPGRLIFLETSHRDLVVRRLSENLRPAHRLLDGTLVVEEPRFDPLAGRVETTWYWSGPRGSGQKRASIRMYTATELVKLVESSGLRFRSAHEGCSTEPFIGGRLGILAARD